MSIQNKSIIKEKSSKKVVDFLEKNKLHKKEFAHMVGVTLSYVYNLIDETIPFSSRGTTLERIATVMDILPEEFDEYLIQEEPAPFNPTLNKIKEKIKKAKLSTLSFLKMFERKKRLDVVDILRGAKSIPIDYEEIKNLSNILKIDKNEGFELWREIFINHLKDHGFDPDKNSKILDEMLKGAKKYIDKTT